jgi:hypothetical protein
MFQGPIKIEGVGLWFTSEMMERHHLVLVSLALAGGAFISVDCKVGKFYIRVLFKLAARRSAPPFRDDLAACVPVLCDWHRGALVVGWWIHGRSGSHVAERLDQAVGSWC